MKTMIGWLMMVVMMVVLTSNSWASFTEVAATADTWMNAGGPDTSYAGLNYLWIGPNKNGLVQIDLTGQIPAGQVITNAMLDVWLTYTGSNVAINVYQETDAWVETAATWNTKDGTNAWGGSAGGFGTGMVSGSNILDTKVIYSGTTGWFQFDVTAAVQAWYGNSASNHGLLLKRGGGGDTKFYSREGASTPKLNITYEAVPEPATLALLLTGTLFALKKK